MKEQAEQIDLVKHIKIPAPLPGQESVWDYPRPPKLEPIRVQLKVFFNGLVLAETNQGYRVLETASPPVYYFPPFDVRSRYLTFSPRRSTCEWKGTAQYWTVKVHKRESLHAAWSYPCPTKEFAAIRNYVAFYSSKMEACYVGKQRVTPQAGDFYGGWITSKILGPFKGEPGTEGW